MVICAASTFDFGSCHLLLTLASDWPGGRSSLMLEGQEIHGFLTTAHKIQSKLRNDEDKLRCIFFAFKEQPRRIKILILLLNNWSIYALLTLFASWFCSIPGPIRLAIPELIPLKFIAAHASVKAGSFVLQANRGAQIGKDLAILNEGESWTRNGCQIIKHNSNVDNSSEVEMRLFCVQCLGKTWRKSQWSSVVKPIKRVCLRQSTNNMMTWL